MTLNANVGLNIAEDVLNSLHAAIQTNRTAMIMDSGEISFEEEDMAASGTLVVHNPADKEIILQDISNKATPL